jgi:hypothetical protein
MQNNNLAQMKNIFNLLKGSSNSEQLIQTMLMQNPNIANAFNTIKANGNYEQVFRNMCKQKGIDPNAFIKMLNS